MVCHSLAKEATLSQSAHLCLSHRVHPFLSIFDTLAAQVIDAVAHIYIKAKLVVLMWLEEQQKKSNTDNYYSIRRQFTWFEAE